MRRAWDVFVRLNGLVAIHLATVHVATGQPDTLFVPDAGRVLALSVRYEPLQQTAQYMGYRGPVPSGVYRAYYPNGKPLIFAVYGYGSLHGDWAEYDEQGRVAVKGQYRDGERHGTWAFRTDGIVGHYRKGQRHGKWKYYQNGRLQRRERYRKGELRQGGTFLFFRNR
jgi:antitoxin component YwqK of YwqJK toxin-antitoxin module